MNDLVVELRERSDSWAGEKGEAYWAGYAAGLLRALEIVEEQP